MAQVAHQLTITKSMVQYVVTPWRTHAELLRVRKQLYLSSETQFNDEDRRHAVAQVSVWMQRGNCPHLVESTALLTAAILNDIAGNSSYCVRAAYATAFCRFVTGLLDSHQDKRRKLSMFSIAKNIGLPETYVELRHQATHEELPSLLKLRTATQRALHWIWGYYWSQLSTDMPEPDCTTCLRQFLEDRNEQTRHELRARLGRFNEDQLLESLTEIGGTTEDTSILLASLELSKTIMGGDRSFGAIKSDPTLSTTAHSLDDIRSELSKMEDELSHSEVQESRESKAVVNPTVVMEEKPWALWKGPWVPRPIGMLS